MPGATSRLALPYPVGSDAPDGPTAFQALAEGLDDAVLYDQGATGSRPTSTPGSPGVAGRLYYDTSTGFLYQDTGTGWRQIPISGAGQIGATDLASNAVTTAKIPDANVTAAKIADESISPDKLTDTVVAHLGLTDSETKGRGVLEVAGQEITSSTSFTFLSTPDRIQNVVLPTDGLIYISYRALWWLGGSATGTAAIFIGANQLKVPVAEGAPLAIAATVTTGHPGPLYTSPANGLDSAGSAATDSSFVTTGQMVGGIVVEAAAGTYDIGVKFKSSSGAVSLAVKERKLWVKAEGY